MPCNDLSTLASAVAAYDAVLLFHVTVAGSHGVVIRCTNIGLPLVPEFRHAPEAKFHTPNVADRICRPAKFDVLNVTNDRDRSGPPFVVPVNNPTLPPKLVFPFDA
jgi:hypothetical protein